MKLEIKFDKSYIIEPKVIEVPSKGKLKITRRKESDGGLTCDYYTIEVYKGKKKLLVFEDVEIGLFESFEQRLVNVFAKQDLVVKCKVVKGAYKVSYDINNPLNGLLKNLKNINTRTKLSFRSVREITKTYIIVDYFGHQVSGSYTYDYEVAPKYVEDIQFTSNRKVEWLGRDTKVPSLGADCYVFKVYHKREHEKNRYEPVGKLLRVENCLSYFAKDRGLEWASIYILHRHLMRNEDSLLKQVGVDIEGHYIVIDGEKAVRVITYEDEYKHYDNEGHSAYKSTRFHATYDNLLGWNGIIEIVKLKLKEYVNFISMQNGGKRKVEKVNYLSTRNMGYVIRFDFDDGYRYRMNSEWYVPSLEKTLQIVT